MNSDGSNVGSPLNLKGSQGIQGVGEDNVQSDWNQSSSSDDSYIKNKPTIPTVPTVVSAFTNDSGYLTEHQSLSGKQNTISDLTTIRSGAALGTTSLQTHQSLSNLVTKVAGKELSTNDFTDDQETKLNSALQTHQSLSNLVVKVVGKGLSDNDFTDTDVSTLGSALQTHQDISGKTNNVAGSSLITDRPTAEGVTL